MTKTTARTIVCDAILFDLDGVLADSEASIVAGWLRWCREIGISEEQYWAGRVFGKRSVDQARSYAPHLDAEEESRRIDQYEIEGAATVTPHPGAINLLNALPRDRWAVATSGVRVLAEARLKAIGAPTPPVLVAADEVVLGKPHPEPYLKAAAHLGVDPARCLVIEDAPAGIEAGKAAGATVLAVATTHDRAVLGRADAIVPNLAAVSLEIVDGRLRLTLAE